MKKLLYLLLSFLMIPALLANPLEKTMQQDKSEKAIYTVMVTLDWNKEDHPRNFPAGAHFSPLVLVSHAEEGAVFALNSLASSGLESQAEIGSPLKLREELNEKLVHGKVGNIDIGPWEGRAQAKRTVSFVISQKFHRVSATTMIAPSPDWFLGIDLSLLSEEGEFVATLTLPLERYDAGTEEGKGFSLHNPDTEPQEPIAFLSSRYFTPSRKEMIPLGTITFTRIQSL